MKLGRHVLSQVIYSLPKIQLNQNSETISSPKNDHPQGLLYAQTAESQTEGGGGKKLLRYNVPLDNPQTNEALSIERLQV
jgi:hypothetical protein